MMTRPLHGPAVLGQLDDLPVRAGGDVVLLLWLGHVVAGIVGADNVVTSGVVLAALDQVPLDPLHGDLVGRVVWTGNGFLPLTKRHSGRVTYYYLL